MGYVFIIFVELSIMYLKRALDICSSHDYWGADCDSHLVLGSHGVPRETTYQLYRQALFFISITLLIVRQYACVS